MAFVFDSTPKSATANSLVSVEDADDYFAGHYRYDTWNALTLEQKQRYLVRATARLDYETYGGTPTLSTEQALQHPRKWMVHRNQADYQTTVVYPEGDYYWDFDLIANPMKKATYEQALWYVDEFNSEPLVSRTDQDRMEGYTVGPLSVNLRRVKEAAFSDEVQRALRSLGPNNWMGGGQLTLSR